MKGCGVSQRFICSTNSDLIGVSNGRYSLDTPCLILDRMVIDNNIAKAARFARQAGKELWPHAKAHKCVEIARRQVAAGAAGLSVASIGEAEVFAAHGLGPIMITSTIATDRQILRIAELIQQGCALTLVADSADFVSRLEACLMARSLRCNILIEIDMGRGRSSCDKPELAVELAIIVENSTALDLSGIQAYAGQLSHTIEYAKRRDAAVQLAYRTGEFMGAISEAVGRPLACCAGGSTGASQLDIDDKFLSSLEWGSNVFMDVEYNAVEICDPTREDVRDMTFGTSLFVGTRVISARPGYYTMDAGDKRFVSKYGASPEVARGASSAAKFTPQSDEYGLLEDPAGDLGIGSMIEVIVPHCDPTVNLFDNLHVVEGDTLVDIWPIEARGVY